MAQLLRITNADFRPRRPGDFVRTETAVDILRTLDLLRHRAEAGVAMIAGAPGTGKSKALEYFSAEIGYDAFTVNVIEGTGTEHGIADLLLSVFGGQGNGMSLVVKHERLRRFIGEGRIVLLDRAENLSSRAAASVTSLALDTGFSLVLCGGLDLQHQVGKVASLRGRVHSSRPVIINRVTRPDVASLVEGTAFATEPAINALHAVSQVFDGGLHNVKAAMHQAVLFAGHERPTSEHLAWAIRDLKLAPKGAQA